ncbi:MAG: hypothetical protein RM368_29360 [Nostoc sp. DedSLP03]|uniref:hypothetical protein n=1 Tax=Nostoc sp. DedSLP03 TaxID=3075400 RepID=UPI002AD3C8BD|nr:hypothetical protein [Nostoc sp. DedSLP03]MDZ7969014.1 hypothetical protein [Nostoc sp. DedSLP03]
MSTYQSSDRAHPFAFFQRIIALTGRDTIDNIRNEKLLKYAQVRDFLNKQYSGRIVPVF